MNKRWLPRPHSYHSQIHSKCASHRIAASHQPCFSRNRQLHCSQRRSSQLPHMPQGTMVHQRLQCGKGRRWASLHKEAQPQRRTQNVAGTVAMSVKDRWPRIVDWFQKLTSDGVSKESAVGFAWRKVGSVWQALQGLEGKHGGSGPTVKNVHI